MNQENTRHTIYKVTDQAMQTHNGFQWVLNELHQTSGEGVLPGPGWLHACTSPYLSILLNPLQADIKEPRLFRGEAWGACREDDGLKVGYANMVLLEELPVPQFTERQRVAFAVFCVQAICDDLSFHQWAQNYLSREGRAWKQAVNLQEVWKTAKGAVTAAGSVRAAAECIEEVEGVAAEVVSQARALVEKMAEVAAMYVAKTGAAGAVGAAPETAVWAVEAGKPIDLIALAERAYNFERE